MLNFEQPLLLLLLLPIGILIYLTWKRMSLPYPKTQRRLILGSRLLLFSCIIMALAGTAWVMPVSRQATIFVGDISASTGPQRSFIEQWIGSAVKHKGVDDQVGIVAVGRNALVEQSIQSQSVDFSHFESTPDTNYTDLAAGLRLASAILPSDSQRHVVLLTDGQQNLEDALQEAQLLQQQGIRLDIVPLPTVNTDDARIDSFNAPSSLHTGERFTLRTRINSTVAQPATVRIYLDSAIISQQKVSLPRGEQEFSFNMAAPTVGFHTFRITLEAPKDAITQNDEAAAFVNVQGAPRILVVEGEPGNGHNIVSALQASHINVSVVTPNDVPSSLDGLVPYSSVILADVPAIALGNTRMQVLQSFVRDLGHGLVVSGGQNSYGVGGYTGTPLEQTLPVNMDIPQHKETPSIAVVLIVESLEEQVQINISKEAAKGVVGLLTPRDQVGISAGYGTLSIKMQHVSDKKTIDKAIDNMNPVDPPSYNPDLSNAEQELLHTDAKIKHIILLGDGDAYDNYAPVVTKLASENITVSTVETNALSSEDLLTMQNIAQWGKGRFYRADNPSIIPQILLKETERASRRSLINERFNPAVVGNNTILTGLTSFPTLDGYVATTPKPAAQMVLVSHLDDPVLAVWQYGLGRVAAWTSDALGLWTKSWLTWNDASRWWANLTTWTLPASNDGGMNINGSVVNGTGQLSVDLPSGTTSEGGQQQVQVHIIAPDLSQQNINLQPSAPERWQGTFPADQVGAYLLQVTWQGANKKQGMLTATTGLVVPYSPEYQNQGTDSRFLQLLAQAGGGILLDPNKVEAAFTQSLLPTNASIPLAFWLLILAAILLPLDIAARRLANLDFIVVGYRWLLKHFQPRNAPTPATASTTEEVPGIAPLSTIRASREKLRNQLAGAIPNLSKPPATEVPRKAPQQNKTVRTRTVTQAKTTPAPQIRQTPPTPAKTEQTVVKANQPPVETGASTSSRLVDAKRKRAQERN
ncbi:glutamine amidotransferase [Dictyobacter arantiisoli]|uniref:VWA domain-containing protein n=1 Tax=Dictyobacter arantiisoli TaxID=2014874 RepID=A0A5A5TC35_9CHLR|nr:glutamine amidotransferase [Dictyobacter arantiisoli]GCF08887.1 VWA domain-containing protein [Dictyobacter arantiisoli]